MDYGVTDVIAKQKFETLKNSKTSSDLFKILSRLSKRPRFISPDSQGLLLSQIVFEATGNLRHADEAIRRALSPSLPADETTGADGEPSHCLVQLEKLALNHCTAYLLPY